MQLRSTNATLIDDNQPILPHSPSYDNGSWPSIAAVSAAGCPLANVSGGAIVVGCFEFVAEPTRKAVLLMNYEAAYDVYATVTFEAQHPMREASQRSGEAISIVDDAPSVPGLQLFFEPGAGRLFVESSNSRYM